MREEENIKNIGQNITRVHKKKFEFDNLHIYIHKTLMTSRSSTTSTTQKRLKIVNDGVINKIQKSNHASGEEEEIARRAVAELRKRDGLIKR